MEIFTGDVKPELLIEQLNANPNIANRIRSFDWIPENGLIRITLSLPDGVTREDVQAVIDAHDPSAMSEAEKIKHVETSSKDAAKNVPGWATWTVDEALTWFDDNLSDAQIDALTDLAGAKVALKRIVAENRAMAQMLLAIRDKIWPDLSS